MPPSKRRKLSPEPEEQDNSATVVDAAIRGDDVSPTQEKEGSSRSVGSNSISADPASSVSTDGTLPTKASTSDRLARFAALKSRASASAKSNLAEAKAEATRAAIDPSVLANLSRRSAIAQHNLLKADTEDSEGAGAFERKRAWDYTIEESEKWDERMAAKKHARDNNAFQDYSVEAGKMYDRQIRELEKQATKDGGKNREEYERQKAEIIENAARTGGLEIVEMDTGELVAIDKDGRFYSSQDSVGFIEQKPKRENVDRLVADLKKAEEARFKKRRDRGRGDDEGDVTYINDKNKQFNLKLARFYDRYTGDIRESFERGTAI
jgi:pre-mRNA-splicing factor SYF2